MKKRILSLLALCCGFFASTSAIYGGNEPPKQTNDNYLTFNNNSINSIKIALNKTGSPDSVSLVYSTDKGSTWADFTVGNFYTIEPGKSVKLAAGSDGTPGKTTNIHFSTSFDMYYCFNFQDSSGSALKDPVVSVSGDITSLLNGVGGDVDLTSTAGGAHYIACFFNLFMACTCITTAPNLPSTKLVDYCYMGTFGKCTNLIKIPDLSHVNLVATDTVFIGTFSGCTNLFITSTGTGNWSIGTNSTSGSCPKVNIIFNGCTNVTIDSLSFGTKYHLGIPGVIFETTTSVGGYYMKGSTKQAMCAFGVTAVSDNLGSITEIGFDVYSGSTVVETIKSTDTSKLSELTSNDGRFYTIIDCNGAGVTKTVKAYAKISSTKYESGAMNATSNLDDEYAI